MESLDRYEVRTVPRSEIKKAPYNPRMITDEARRKLRKGLEKLGNLQPPVWNARTGNIVGGHQRIAIFDAVHGTDAYELRVAAVDLTPKQEKEANILLNNYEAQGGWDIEKLGGMLREGLELEATGFGAADLHRLLGTTPDGLPTAALEELSAGIRQAEEQAANLKSRVSARDDVDFYAVVVFRSNEERNEFYELLGLDENRYQSGDQVRAAIEELSSRPKEAKG